jgi:hypothetical protein
MFQAGAFNAESLKIFDGPLYNPGIMAANRMGANVNVTFDRNTPDSLGADDAAVCVIMDAEGGNVRYAAGRRGSGAVSVSLATVPNADSLKLYAYLAFSRAPLPDTSEKGIVSETDMDEVA